MGGCLVRRVQASAEIGKPRLDHHRVGLDTTGRQQPTDRRTLVGAHPTLDLLGSGISAQRPDGILQSDVDLTALLHGGASDVEGDQSDRGSGSHSR